MRQFLIALVVSLGLVGCASTIPVAPETPRERLVSAEAGYEFALLEVRMLIVQGIIIPNSQLANRMGLLIIESRNALDVWQTNPDNPNFLVLGIAALRHFQALIAANIVTQESGVWPPGLDEKFPEGRAIT